MEEVKLIVVLFLLMRRKIKVSQYISKIRLLPTEILTTEFIESLRKSNARKFHDLKTKFLEYYSTWEWYDDELEVNYVIVKMRKMYKKYRKHSDDYLLTFVKEKFQSLIINHTNQQLLEGHDLDRRFQILEQGHSLIKEFRDEKRARQSLDLSDMEQVKAYEKELKSRKEEIDFRIKTKWPTLDQYFSNGTDLGLACRRIVLLFGIAKRFKTTLMYNAALRAYHQGYNVRFYTLEMSLEDIFEKSKLIVNPIALAKVKKDKGRNNFFKVEYYPSYTFGLSNLNQDLQNDKDKGNPTHWVGIDYIEVMFHRLFTTLRNSSDKRFGINQLYYGLRDSVNYYNYMLWTISQANRGAVKKKGKAAESGDIAEDWSKVAAIDYLLSTNQTPDQRKARIIMLKLLESRWTDWDKLKTDELFLKYKSPTLLFKEIVSKL